MASGISYLDQLTPEKDDWKIRVRIIRLWKQHAYMNPTEFISLDMLLMDEEGDKIHATVKKHLLVKFEPLLQEGCVYVISNFGVAENTLGFKMATHPYKINFYRMTLVKAFTSQFIGSRYGLDFKPFVDIVDGTIDAGHAFDIIGRITDSGGLYVVNRDGKCIKRFAFQLTDLDGVTVDCTLWGQLAQELGDYIADMVTNIHVILIIQLGRLRTWDEKPNVSNCYFGTRILINVDLDEIADFKARMDNQALVTHVPALASEKVYSVLDAFAADCEMKRVDEIREIKRAGKYILVATIVCVQKDEDWYYLACRKCKKGVEVDEVVGGKEVWMCPKCVKSGVDVAHGFKVQVRVQDNTGSMSLVLFDEVVKNIIKKSASELLAEISMESEDDCFPDELNELVGKKFVFKIDVDKLNINRNSRVYTVAKMTDDAQVLAKFLNKDGTDAAGDSNEMTPPATPAANGKRRIGMVGNDQDVESSTIKSKLPSKTRKK